MSKEDEDLGAQLIEEIREKVERGPGWYAVAVGAGVEGKEEVPPFIYTVGLTSASLPELVISGFLKPAVGHAILRGLIERLRSGELTYEGVPASGKCVDGILQNGFDIYIRKVTGPRQHERLTMAIRYQRDTGGQASDVLSLQIVLPDEENRFPWDEEFRGSPEQERLWE